MFAYGNMISDPTLVDLTSTSLFYVHVPTSDYCGSAVTSESSSLFMGNDRY